jgi:hypothetical protein
MKRERLTSQTEARQTPGGLIISRPWEIPTLPVGRISDLRVYGNFLPDDAPEGLRLTVDEFCRLWHGLGVSSPLGVEHR